MVSLFSLLVIFWSSLFLNPSYAGFQKVQDFVTSEKKGTLTNTLLVWKKDQLLWEYFRAPYKAETLQPLWSISKSVLAMLLLKICAERNIPLTSPLKTFLPSLNLSPQGELSLQSLLQMKSGLCWKEGYEASPLQSDVLEMLYGEGRQNMGAYALSRGICHQEGEVFLYSSGTTNILALVLKNILGNEFNAYTKKILSQDFKMPSAVWEKDDSGNLVASSYLFSTAPELLSFGIGVLGKVKTDDPFYIPAWEWDPDFFTKQRTLNKDHQPYGGHFWLARTPEGRHWPHIPEDTLLALGHEGQMLAIIPSLDIIIVRLAVDTETFDKDTLFSLILEAAQ